MILGTRAQISLAKKRGSKISIFHATNLARITTSIRSGHSRKGVRHLPCVTPSRKSLVCGPVFLSSSDPEKDLFICFGV